MSSTELNKTLEKLSSISYCAKSNKTFEFMSLAHHLNDKIVESGITRILQSIYEADFYEFSYGFRPKKNAHQALKVVGDRIRFSLLT